MRCLVFIFAILYCSTVFSQKIEGKKLFSQEIVVYNNSRIRSFLREGDNHNWENWTEIKPYKPGSNVRRYKSLPISSDEVNRIVGEKWMTYINRKRPLHLRSGYYNLSGLKGYDWPSRGGDNYGVYKHKKTIRIKQPGTL